MLEQMSCSLCASQVCNETVIEKSKSRKFASHCWMLIEHVQTAVILDFFFVSGIFVPRLAEIERRPSAFALN